MKQLPATPSIEIAPSILSADFADLARHIATIENSVKILHLDVMDGHFVPNITFGPCLIKKIRHHSDLFFDAHLMIDNPIKYAPEFIKAGSDGITIHLESPCDTMDAIRVIRDLGASVGISLKPGTPVEQLHPYVEYVDMVLLMTVEPGFGGQAFMTDGPERARKIRNMLRDDQRLEVDGGIDVGTASLIVQAGADTLVAGNAIFGKPDPAQAVSDILASIC
ncbi:MAG: ribulose-phosphate 3-epimerase [Phycisphaerae bacterium]|nr:ribulose-phosphate 3-epimerase [Phycisphaerae bacterium]